MLCQGCICTYRSERVRKTSSLSHKIRRMNSSSSSLSILLSLFHPFVLSLTTTSPLEEGVGCHTRLKVSTPVPLPSLRSRSAPTGSYGVVKETLNFYRVTYHRESRSNLELTGKEPGGTRISLRHERFC